MANRALTPRTVETARPRHNASGVAVRTELPDGGARGLRLVLFPTGRKSWIVRYRYKGRQRKLTLPGFVTLAEARRAASEAMLEVDHGIDPATKRHQEAALAGAEAAKQKADTVEHWIEEFCAKHVSKKRENTIVQYKYILKRIALPAWRDRAVHEITRRDVVHLLGMVAKDRPVMANRVWAVAHKFFAWMVAQSVLEHSPATGVERPAEEEPRERVLSDDEVRSLWKACGVLDDSGRESFQRMAGAVRLLTLTGQRVREVIDVPRSEIEGDLWTLPSRRAKNKIEHAVPLSAQALAVIASMPDRGEPVFAPLGGNQITDAKAILDKAMKPLQPWTLRDIRRTVASGMARIGIAMPVTEKVLNHQSGSFAGIASVYQKYDYLVEKRDALQRWGAHVESIVR